MDVFKIVFLVVELLLGLTAMWLGARVLLEAMAWLRRVVGIAEMSLGAALVSTVTIVVELFLGVVAVSHGLSGLVMTQVVGLVIFNLGLILGVSLLFGDEKKIDRSKFLWRGGMLIFILGVLGYQVRDGLISNGEAGFLLFMTLGVVAYTVIEILWEARNQAEKANQIEAAAEAKARNQRGKIKRTGKKVKEVVKMARQRTWWSWQANQIKKKGQSNLWLNLARVIMGTVLMLVAAGYFLRNGVQISLIFKWPMMLAAGSLLVWGAGLPELMTAIGAAWRKRQEISVGNIFGVSMMCLTLVIGVSAWLSSQEFLARWQTGLRQWNDGEVVINGWKIFGEGNLHPEAMMVNPRVGEWEIPVAIVMVLVALVPAAVKGKFLRWQGAVLVLGYLFYIIDLFIKTS